MRQIGLCALKYSVAFAVPVLAERYRLQLLRNIMWGSSVPNFVQVAKKAWKMPVEIHLLPSVKNVVGRVAQSV
jgi:hypothetical protein